MTDQPSPEDIFFTQGGLDRVRVGALVDEALHGVDDGELFLEYRQSESFSYDDGRLKNASFDTSQGFGLRAVCGEATGYAHATELSEQAIGRAAATVRAVRAGYDGSLGEPPPGTNRALYGAGNPLGEIDFAAKVKLLADIDGVPMIVRVVDAALASRAKPVVVVTGHQADQVRAALGRRRRVAFVHNPDYAAGLSSSLERGLAALEPDVDGALICLGDMPQVAKVHLNRLIDAFNPLEGRAICVPTTGGKRGNPVLWARRFFADMMRTSGDVGARHLIGENAELVSEVEMADEGVLIDIDSPQALTALKRAKSS